MYAYFIGSNIEFYWGTSKQIMSVTCMDCELFCYDMVLRWVFWGNWQLIGGVDLGGLSISVTRFKEGVENFLELESLPNMDPKTPLFTLCSQNQPIWWTTCNVKLVGGTPANLGKQVFWEHCNHNRPSFSCSHRWLHIHNTLCGWARFLCDYMEPHQKPGRGIII